MSDWICMDTDETLNLVRQLERLGDEMDGVSVRLRTIAYYLQQPEEASAALYAQRRRICQLMENTDRMAVRLRQAVDLFGDCEKRMKDQMDVFTSDYMYLKKNFQVEDNHLSSK